MSQLGVQPIERGKTLYAGRTIDVSSAYANLTDTHYEGIPKVFRNTKTSPELTSGDQYGVALRDSAEVRCVLVRNVSGITLLPGFMVTWKSGQKGKRVDGYHRLGIGALLPTPIMAGMVDDMLPASGVPDGDVFWLIVEGNGLGYTPLAGGDFCTTFGGAVSWAFGDFLVGLTAAVSTGVTSGATSGVLTSGRGQCVPATGMTATQTTDGTLLALSNFKFARVLSAKTSGQTNSRCLLDLKFF